MPWRSPRVILLVAAIAVVAYAFPGYLNFDAADQLSQAPTGSYGDWHPPMMAAYWAVLDGVVRGPAPMLLLQVGLFLFGLHDLVRARFAPNAAAWITAGLMLFPPILTP